MTATSIGWTATLKIRPVNVDAFRKIAEGAAREVKDTEPHCVVYEWVLSPESGVCTVHEWFRDQEAAIAHITGVAPAKYLPQALQIADLLGVDVFGTPGPELSKDLAGFVAFNRYDVR